MNQVYHLQLAEPQQGRLQFHFWEDNRNLRTTRDLALKEIDDLIAHTEDHYYSGTPRLEIGRRLFDWLDGPERSLSHKIDTARHTGGVLVLAIECARALAHLPWEIMADRNGFLIERQNPFIVPARWTDAQSSWPAPANRSLRTLFMAASPDEGGTPLDFEKEEGRILSAAVVDGERLMDLVVEESGCLADLKLLISLYGEDWFDIFHLTGHAGHSGEKGDQPVFYLEDDEGKPAPANAAALSDALVHRPRIAFLSGCRTAQSPARGELHSLAEALLHGGLPAVLGWGRPIADSHATLAAEFLYGRLACGDSVPVALSQTWRGLIAKDATGWHLLRLHFAGAAPGALVTPPAHEGRPRLPVRRPSERFLIPGNLGTKVPAADQFVGRRRLLQRCLRKLRAANTAGIVLHGTGGLGKSSIVSRLCDRLEKRFVTAPVFGVCDEPALVNALAEVLPHDAQSARDALRGQGELHHRLGAALEACPKKVLFVLDDYEQNQTPPSAGDSLASVSPEAARVLKALLQAVRDNGSARLLLTTRYALPPALIPGVDQEPVEPMDRADERKRIARLDQLHQRAAGQPPEMRERVRTAAGGNHRLLEWLHTVLDQPGLDHPMILAALEAEEQRFREDVLAATLVAALPDETRALLAGMLVCHLPVPEQAAAALNPAGAPVGVVPSLHTAVAWGLASVAQINHVPHWLVPQFLEPVLEPDAETRIEAAAKNAAAVYMPLRHLWLESAAGISEERLLEMLRLSLLAGNSKAAFDHADRLSSYWLEKHRYREADLIAESTMLAAGSRDPRLVTAQARASRMLGDGKRATMLFEEASRLQTDQDMDGEKAATLFNYAGLLMQQGKLTEAENVYREQLLPWFISLGESGARSRAVTQGQIADIMEARGDLESALRIRLEEVIPVFEKLGDVRSRAVTQGKIADIMEARGDLEGALRIRLEEQLPVYEKLGDVRSSAVTQGKIADIMQARGDLEGALRIRLEEVIPVFEKLGDVRERAVTQAKIADIMEARGDLEGARRVRLEQVIPVFEKLGDVRSRAVTQGKIADIMQARGDLEGALRIRREEELPVYEKLGDVRERAVTQGKIADIMEARGDLDGALRIRLEEQLPVYEKLGDVRERAMTQGKIANIMLARGDLEGALRIRREEELPVYEKLGDVRSQLVGRTMIAQLLATRGNHEDVSEIVANLTWSWREARRMQLPEAGQIEQLAAEMGMPEGMLAEVAAQLQG